MPTSSFPTPRENRYFEDYVVGSVKTAGNVPLPGEGPFVGRARQTTDFAGGRRSWGSGRWSWPSDSRRSTRK